MRFWICSSGQKRKRRINHRLCCNPMVQTTRTSCRRRLWKINRHVGSSLHNVWIDWWKSFVSRRKLIGSIVLNSKVLRTSSTRSTWKVYQKSKIFRNEVSLNPNFGLDRQEILRKNMPKRSLFYKGLIKAES